MNYIELLNDNYKQSGNWYIKGLLSVNLFTKEVKSNTSKITFSVICNNISIDLLNKINNTLTEIVI